MAQTLRTFNLMTNDNLLDYWGKSYLKNVEIVKNIAFLKIATSETHFGFAKKSQACSEKVAN